MRKKNIDSNYGFPFIPLKYFWLTTSTYTYQNQKTIFKWQIDISSIFVRINNSFVQKIRFSIFMSKYVSKFRFKCPSIMSRTAQFIIIFCAFIIHWVNTYGTFFVIKPYKPKLDFANRVYYTVCKSSPNLSSGIKVIFLEFFNFTCFDGKLILFVIWNYISFHHHQTRFII
jgi:hypothetical protein